MKKLIIFLMLFNTSIGFAQFTYFVKPHTNNAEASHVLCEINNTIIIGGYYYDSLSSSNYTAYFQKIDQFGNIVKTTKYTNPGFNVDNVSVSIFNDTIYAFCGAINNQVSQIILLKFDISLNLISEHKLNIESQNEIEFYFCIRNNENNFILAGTCDSIVNGYPNGFLYKISTNGDSIMYRNIGTMIVKDIIENKVNNQYYIFAETGGTTSSKIMKYNSNFDFLKSDTIPYQMGNALSPKWINNNQLVITGASLKLPHSLENISFSLIDSLAIPNKYVEIGKLDTCDYTAWIKGTDINSNSIYSAWTSNYDRYFFTLNNLQASYIGIVKFDYLLNEKWLRYYGDDTSYYQVQSLITTSDGGCAVTGWVNNRYHPEWITDVFLLKLDSLGNCTWIKTIHQQETNFVLFPNPATNTIQISNLGITKNEIFLYDLTGKLLKSQTNKDDITSMDISTFPNGIYLIKVVYADGKIASKKFVKQ